jgi:alcohol dehydrogenase class IV
MPFTFLTTPEIRFGPRESARAKETALRFGRRPFLVTGGRSFDALWIAPSLAGVPRFAVRGEPDIASIDEAAALCREAGADVVLGVGGGSALDTAKAVAAMAVHEGSVRDYLEQVGDRKLDRPPLPSVAVPTTAGSGSEATKNAVIRVPDLKVKRSLRHERLLPRVALVDPELSGSAPAAVAASAGLDALTHLIEGYVSTGAQPTTDALALPGIRLAARGLRALAGRSRSPEAREAMALASFWGGIVLANAGLGAVHGLVAPLGGRSAIAHGTACACLLVETVRANVAALRTRDPGSPALDRYAEAARALGAPSVEAALEELVSLRRRLGVEPLSFYGATEADVAPIVGASRGGSMKSNPVELTDAELAGIVRAALQPAVP